MIWTFNPKLMAQQIREGKLTRIDIVAKLDEPASEGDLPVLWITNQKKEKQFALKQSHACVNRGVGKTGETWKLWINRFGEFFLVEKVPYAISDLLSKHDGYACVVHAKDGNYFADWVPTQRIILEGE